MMAKIDIRMGDMMKQITLCFRIPDYRRWRVRMTVGIWLLRLAAFVTGCGIEYTGMERVE